MGLRDLWNRLTGGDREQRVEEQLREEGSEQPVPLEDYEAMKQDRVVEERFPGTEHLDSDP